MRIGLVSDTYTPQVNGVTTVVRRIARVLERNGHEVGVVAPAYPGAAAPGSGELRVPSLPFPLYRAIRLSLPLRRRVDDFLDRLDPHVVHVCTEGPLGALGRWWALAHRVPLVTSFHTHFPEYARHYGAPFLAPLVWHWLVRFHQPARLTHTPGAAIRDELARRGLSQAVVWGRGVDAAHFRPSRRDAGWRRWLAGADETAVVLHVGRLAPEKNLDVLMESWRLAHTVLGTRATFVVAGEGPVARRLHARLPFVRQLGFLDRDTLAAVYASADLCVLPSPTETCGLVALEAMASGLPVVAADAGGLRENVRHGRTGLLIPPRDARGFLDAIVALVMSPPLRTGLGQAARAAALERDVAHEDAELLEHYASLGTPREPGGLTCAA